MKPFYLHTNMQIAKMLQVSMYYMYICIKNERACDERQLASKRGKMSSVHKQARNSICVFGQLLSSKEKKNK